MALYQRKLGHQADVVIRKEFTGGFLEFYGFTKYVLPIKKEIDHSTPTRKIYDKLPAIIKLSMRSLKRRVRSITFYLFVRKHSKNYDILHIHSVWKTVLLVPFKKKILEFHGDDMRKNPSFMPWWKRVVVRSFIRLYTVFAPIYVSTPDLLDEGFSNVVYIPNPVDPHHFARLNEPEPKTALYTHSWYMSKDHARELASCLGLDLTILDRTSGVWISHEDFPAYLSKFEYFIDRKEIPSLSKTGLEALVMGLKLVQGWDGKVLEGLDSQHYPDRVAENVMEIYRKTLKMRLVWSDKR